MKIPKLLSHSYTPYSGKQELAVVKSKDGKYFPGVRIENASFPLTITAAQNALFCCLSEGHQPEELAATNIEDPQLPFWEEELGIEISELKINDLPDFDFADLRLEKSIEPKTTLSDLLGKAIVNESNFPVAALVETENGYFSGVNIECTSWNMGLCAERVALAKALTYNSTKLKKLYIHTSKGEFSSPCGACRQVIIEHMSGRQVHLHHADHSESVHFADDLLPYGFHSSSLTE
ncbi:MAG TPA: cytidine deaminase [Balneolaceae bacterium]